MLLLRRPGVRRPQSPMLQSLAFAGVAQAAEHGFGKAEVRGSSPRASSKPHGAGEARALHWRQTRRGSSVVEHAAHNRSVGGSIPPPATTRDFGGASVASVYSTTVLADRFG